MEDTFESNENTMDAIRAARGVAKQGQARDPVSVLERGGKAVQKLILMPNRTVAETAISQ